MPRRRDEQAAYLPVSQKRLHSFYQSSRAWNERASEVRSAAVAGNKATDVEWRIISPSKLLIISLTRLLASLSSRFESEKEDWCGRSGVAE